MGTDATQTTEVTPTTVRKQAGEAAHTGDAAQTYASVKERLDEIVESVADENISLDDALGLYEEAVQLGLKVSNLLEEDISEEETEAVLADQMDSQELENDAFPEIEN